MDVLRQFVKKAPLAQEFLSVRAEESLRLHWEHFDFEAQKLSRK